MYCMHIVHYHIHMKRRIHVSYEEDDIHIVQRL
jgi:hypothetical protein